VYVKAQDGRLVQLSNIASLQESGGSSIINRVDRQRVVTIFANLEVKPLGQAINELNEISGKVLTAGYSGRYKDQADMMAESFGYLMFAMIFGMLPIAIGIGGGAETRSPMALATISGLLTSLLLTLIAVPVAYDLFDEFQGRIFKIKPIKNEE